MVKGSTVSMEEQCLKDNKTQKISSSPDINEYQDILDAARNRELIVFVGAGVSKIKGYYSWTEFARNKIETMFQKDIIEYADKVCLEQMDPRKALTLCKIIIQESQKQDLMPRDDELIGRTHENESKIYEYLYRFNTTFVTTNYDTCLDEMMRKRDIVLNDTKNIIMPQLRISNGNVYIEDKDFIPNRLGKTGNIFHIHGSFDNLNNITATINDYLKKYSDDNTLPYFLKCLFSHYTVLFVGYGLAEFEILDNIVNAGSKGTDVERNHYCLFPVLSSEERMLKYNKKYYENLGITLIPYSIDHTGYNALEEIIKKWSVKFEKVAPNYPNLQGLALIDEVVK